MRLPDPDRLIAGFDTALRTLTRVDQSSRPNPAEGVEETANSEQERRLAGRLMRINHCGEVCAQALYLGQGLTSHDAKTQAAMQQAGEEEQDHLTWCRERLKELDTPTSRLDPIFFGLSFTGGVISGLLGDRVNLGFVAATEEQVVKHLDAHLEQLTEDARSRAILEQMKQDEDHHRSTALKRGGTDFPGPAKSAMTLLSRVMTRTTYWV